MTWFLLLFLLFVSSVRAHDLEEIRSHLKGDVPEEIEKITKAFENSQQSLLRKQLHAAQHEMLLDHDRGLAKVKCAKLLEKLSTLERKTTEAKEAGKTQQEAETLAAKIRAFTSVNCNFIN